MNLTLMIINKDDTTNPEALFTAEGLTKVLAKQTLTVQPWAHELPKAVRRSVQLARTASY